jgi:hypothetical protein
MPRAWSKIDPPRRAAGSRVKLWNDLSDSRTIRRFLDCRQPRRLRGPMIDSSAAERDIARP